MNKKIVAAGLAAGLLAGAGVGYALENSNDHGDERHDQVVVASDENGNTPIPLGGNGQDGRDDRDGGDGQGDLDPTARLQEVLQPLVDDGTLTQEQADKVIAALANAGPLGRGDGDGDHRGPAGQDGQTGQTGQKPMIDGGPADTSTTVKA